MLQQPEPGDWVVATGETWSIQQILNYVLDSVGIERGTIYNEAYTRPQELNYLKGDSSKIRDLGWRPEYTTEKTLDEMIDYWMKFYK